MPMFNVNLFSNFTVPKAARITFSWFWRNSVFGSPEMQLLDAQKDFPASRNSQW